MELLHSKWIQCNLVWIPSVCLSVCLSVGTYVVCLSVCLSVCLFEITFHSFPLWRWPPGERAGYCYLPPNLETDADCQMKAGNPYGAFWDELGVEFDSSKATWLSFNISNEDILKQWVEK